MTSGVAAVSAASNHSCGVTSSSDIPIPGDYNGDGTTDMAVFRASNITWYISSLGGFLFGAAGGVKCWGDNDDGQVGDGTTVDRLAPVAVSGLASDVSALSINGDHSCARMSNGAAKCWGNNADGQLGNGTLLNSNVAVETLLSSSPTYTYGGTHKHAVTALSTGESYTYDANGNMITRVESGLTYTQTFDVENRLVSVEVNGQTTQFVYDGDGNLVKQIKPDGSRTLYIGGVYEVDKNASDVVTQTVTYYPAGGAMRIDGILYYALKDHLGSASVMTDDDGMEVGQQRYYPYGETRWTTGNLFTDRLFTGQREMADLGIYHYNARFYSPYINRFLSADTIVPGYANPQNLNRYSYVGNSPINYVDPSGHMRLREGPQQDRFKPSVANAYVPKPKKQDNSGGTFDCDGDPTCYSEARGQLWDKGYSGFEIPILQEIYIYGGSHGQYYVDYVVEQDVHIKVGGYADPRGWFGARAAWYTADSKYIVLNPWTYNEATTPDPWGLSLVVHEAVHIKQGPLEAFSQAGEFEAWKIGIEVAQNLGYGSGGLGPRDAGVMSAQSVEEFAGVVEKEAPSYWSFLSLLPTYPDPNWPGFIILPGP